ncbi:Uu.00g025250.m01.CDS01 [Anthostomella pinea]|uniref:Tyrosine--tRNA ligase n=1 Tax=Anthostomella pinea TaxID=933095 RepID=A0AAI8V7U3_9PEZI|nr:Uu.00g025250.m01.CDS01 [Anthostomella pinea]
MVAAALLASSHNARSTLCRTCLLRSLASRRQPSRFIGLKVLEKRRLAHEAWQERARQIEAGEVPHLWDTLKERGFVKDTAGTDDQISELMRVKRIGAYVGIDPTAASLHLGHLLPLMALYWMYIHGYRTVSVVGGATAKVGDPTGRLQSRDRIAKADMTMYITKIHYQLKRMWAHVDSQARRHGYEKEWVWDRELANNSQWYNTVSFAEVVQRLFNGVRVGPMLSRESVKRRMAEGDGMSLAEFVYPLMQAWDWWHLYSSPKGCLMQIGGSDQYGNIVSGVDAVKYLRDTERDPAILQRDGLLEPPVGFTTPLLTDSSGAKFGKSAGNAVWLDPFMTSPFDLYGYFMRRPDADVEQLLKLFTFHPMDKIREIMTQHSQDPPKRHAQHALAYEVLALVHGQNEADAVRKRHRQMFSKGPVDASQTQTSEESSETEFFPPKGTPADANRAGSFRVDIQLPESLIKGKSIGRILYAAGLADSASDGHRLVTNQGAYIGGSPGRKAFEAKEMREGELTFTPVKNWFPQETSNYLIDGKLLLLRRGKYFVRVVEMVSDEEWAASGQSYHGEPGSGKTRILREKLKAAAGGEDLHYSDAELAQIEKEADDIMRDEEEKDEPSSTPEVRFPPQTARARQILEKSPMARLVTQEGYSSKLKTEAIDKVLAQTRIIIQAEKRRSAKAAVIAAERKAQQSAIAERLSKDREYRDRRSAERTERKQQKAEARSTRNFFDTGPEERR